MAIACALDGAESAQSECTLEAVESSTGRGYVLHRPDGGFRRIAPGPDGRYIATDGADAPTQREESGRMLVSIADDVYVLPPEDELRHDP